jgi:hypothetical protein
MPASHKRFTLPAALFFLVNWSASSSDKNKQKQTLWPESASELYLPSDRHLLENLVPTITNNGVSRSQRGGFLMAVFSVF